MYSGDVPELSLIVIDWLDASELQNWRYADADTLKRMQPVKAQTCGWVVRSDLASISVTQTKGIAEGDSDMLLNNVMTIPRGCIKRLIYLTQNTD